MIGRRTTRSQYQSYAYICSAYSHRWQRELAVLNGATPRLDVRRFERDDLRNLPLIERKRALKATMPRSQRRLLYVDHLRRRGNALFTAVCERDLEGVVAKWAQGSYHTDGVSTSWAKIKNSEYSQMVGRRELFEARRDGRQTRRRGYVPPVLALR